MSLPGIQPQRHPASASSSGSQGAYDYVEEIRPGFISPAEADALWAKFEADFPEILAELKSKHPDIKQLFIGSFIGRTNPPHDGHIMAIQTVILEALSKEGGSALILLGSGPGKISNAQNPIPFQLKRLFIICKLINSDRGFISDLFINGKINILEMDKPVAQTTRVFSEQVSPEQVSPDIMHLGNILFVGNKDGDAEKLTFYKIGVGKGVTVDGIYYPIKTSIMPIDPITTGAGEPMSATKVREFVKNQRLEEFRVAFGGLYNIFPLIDFLQQFLPEEEKQPFVDKYRLYILDNSTLDFARLFYNTIRSEFEKEIEAAKAVKAVKAVKVTEVVPIEVVPNTSGEKRGTENPRSKGSNSKKATKEASIKKGGSRRKTKRRRTKRRKTKRRKTKRRRNRRTKRRRSQKN